MSRTCETYAQWISEAHNGTLPAGRRAELEQHLRACPECRVLDAEMARLLAILRRMPPPEPPAGLADRIMEQAWHPQPAQVVSFPWWQTWRNRVAVAGAVAAALVLGVWLGFRAAPGPADPLAGRLAQHQPASFEPGQRLLEDFMQDYVPVEVVNPLSDETLSIASMAMGDVPAEQ